MMNAPRLAVPPGRTGRLWLQRRLATARRGCDLLDRKLRILQMEAARLRTSAAQTAVEWERSQARADEWLLRAALLGGERAIRLSADVSPADLTITHSMIMGMRYPARGMCTIPPASTWDGSAVIAARRAHRVALTAAVDHAVAAEALRIIEAEALATRYRLRAVRDRWMPRLEQALAEVTFALEEQERADAARLRLAAPAAASPGEGPHPPARTVPSVDG